MMGARGPGNFDDDDALDFVAELSAEQVRARLEAVATLDEDEPLDAPNAAMALVAAEAVATATPADGPGERALGRRVVDRVRTDSELSDLWAESAEEFEARAAVTESLYCRLEGG